MRKKKDFSQLPSGATRSLTEGEQSNILELFGKYELPDGVKKLEFFSGEDSSGEPAIWIIFVVDKEFKPTDEKLTSINELGKKLQNKILASSQYSQWPYTGVRSLQRFLD